MNNELEILILASINPSGGYGSDTKQMCILRFEVNQRTGEVDQKSYFNFDFEAESTYGKYTFITADKQKSEPLYLVLECMRD